MAKLDGKIALVTGGNSGIGFAIAKQFIDEGAFVIVTARRKSKLEEAVSELGDRAAGFTADVSNLKALDDLYQYIKEKFGKLDIVVANAGGGKFQSLGEITEDNYYSTFDTNVKGVIFTVQKHCHFFPHRHQLSLRDPVPRLVEHPRLAYTVPVKVPLEILSAAGFWT